MNHVGVFEGFVGIFFKDQQFFEFDKAHNISTVLAKHWNFRIVVLLEFFQKRGIHMTILVDHENTVNGNHVIVDLFETQINSILENLDLFRPITILFVIMQ